MMRRFCTTTVAGPANKRLKIARSKHTEMITGKSSDGKETFTLFYSAEDPLSNFYPAKFTLNGESFNCTEQYFHYMKAVIFDDKKSQEAILKASSPNKQKSLGRKVKNFEAQVWSNVCVEYMKDACKAKFEQNADLKKILLDTAGTTIVEAAPRDRKWGIGLGKSNPDCFNRHKWKGENLLGKALMDVRRRMMESEQQQSSPAVPVEDVDTISEVNHVDSFNS